MKKLVTISIIFTIFFFLIPLTINASYDAVITGSNVQIRSGAGKENHSMYSVNAGTMILVYDKTLYEGSGCSEKWYKISYKDNTGYVCSKYVRLVDNAFSGINVIDWTSRTSGNNIAVRSGAGRNYSTQDTLSLGANVEILATQDGGSDGCSSGKWYKIKYYGSKIGYICSNYIVNKADITAENEEYANTLKAAGFPDSYIPYLVYLHNKYPTWNFVAKQTNKDFSISVSSEEGKNYMQTTNDNYRTSSTPAEGSSWFKVNSQVIAFYMDPRNWLNEQRIFMFEKLDYSDDLEESYPSLVKSIFGSGALGSDEYTIPMVNAGRTNRISPVHIASRIRQEVGSNGSASTDGREFTFKGQTYSGYYNFFNIGAYEETIDGVKYSAVTRGLAYAAKLINRSGELWNNIETAITEGSSFLANGYITKGQGTLYYQKFNVSPDAYYSSYTHQYMTNIQAPATEGNSSYNSYGASGTLSEPFIFEIPVYNNMPAYTSLPNSGDTNNNLSSLEIEGFNINPSFDKDILTYEVYIPKDTTKLNIITALESNKSTISGNGEIGITDETTDITIIVTSETGNEKRYVITIRKVEDNTTVDTVLQKSGISINDNYYKIKNNTTVSTIKNSLIQNGASGVIVNKDNSTYDGNDIICTGFTFTISTALDTKTFTFVVNGDTSGDGNITILDLLQIQKHIKGASTLSGANLLAADTSGDNSVTILDLLQVQKHIKGAKSL